MSSTQNRQVSQHKAEVLEQRLLQQNKEKSMPQQGNRISPL